MTSTMTNWGENTILPNLEVAPKAIYIADNNFHRYPLLPGRKARLNQFPTFRYVTSTSRF
jgi:hypothetical protein